MTQVDKETERGTLVSCGQAAKHFPCFFGNLFGARLGFSVARLLIGTGLLPSQYHRTGCQRLKLQAIIDHNSRYCKIDFSLAGWQMSITSVPTPERCRHVDQACSHVSLAIFCAVDLFQAYWWGLAHSWQSNFGLFGFAEVEAQLSFCAMDLSFLCRKYFITPEAAKVCRKPNAGLYSPKPRHLWCCWTWLHAANSRLKHMTCCSPCQSCFSCTTCRSWIANTPSTCLILFSAWCLIFIEFHSSAVWTPCGNVKRLSVHSETGGFPQAFVLDRHWCSLSSFLEKSMLAAGAFYVYDHLTMASIALQSMVRLVGTSFWTLFLVRMILCQGKVQIQTNSNNLFTQFAPLHGRPHNGLWALLLGTVASDRSSRERRSSRGMWFWSQDLLQLGNLEREMFTLWPCFSWEMLLKTSKRCPPEFRLFRLEKPFTLKLWCFLSLLRLLFS